MSFAYQKRLYIFTLFTLAVMVVSLTHFYQPTLLTAVSHYTSKSSFVLHSLDDIHSLVQRRFQGLGNGSIPRIVHITNKSPQLPQQYEELLRHCTQLNPDVTFLFWSDEQAEKFVAQSAERLQRSNDSEEWRWSKFLSTYSGIEKGDVIRLLLLYFLGGVYMDLDTECRQSFHQLHLSVGQLLNQKYNPPVSNNTNVSSDSAVTCIIDQEQWLQTRIFYSREYVAMNNFMICRPKHPFFRYVLENMKDNDRKTHIMLKTGPLMLTARYEEYNRILRLTTSFNQSAQWINNNKTMNSSQSNRLREDTLVELAHPDWFSPLVDNRPEFAIVCSQNVIRNHWINVACSEDYPHYKATLQTRVQASFVIHRFLHLGYDYYSHRIKKTFQVSSVFGVYLVQLF